MRWIGQFTFQAGGEPLPGCRLLLVHKLGARWTLILTILALVVVTSRHLWDALRGSEPRLHSGVKEEPLASAKRSSCCDAGREFRSVDHASELAVGLCRWPSPGVLACWVLRWAPTPVHQSGAVRELPVSENWTRQTRHAPLHSFPLSPTRRGGGYLPFLPACARYLFIPRSRVTPRSHLCQSRHSLRSW